jgi:serine/threonine protein kinase
MSYKQSNGNKRRLADYSEHSRNRTALEAQEIHRKRRRNSNEKTQDQAKKARKGSDDDHLIDSKFPDWHDKDGHFNYRAGESLGDELDSSQPDRRRYKLIDKLGQGTFGLVLLAWDRIENCFVAVKIVRAIKKYTESALTEIEILTKIQRSGLEELEESLEQISFSGEKSSKNSNTKKLNKRNIPKHCCISLESWFSYKEHICMVFQKFGLSLYDYLKATEFKGLNYSMTQDIAFNLFASLYYLHEGLQLIHTDLKPENILFVDDGGAVCRHGEKSPDVRGVPPKLNSSEIKIIDLGSATFEDEYHSTVISTRHYRAPEVILQVGWSFPSDVWSVGCILLELYTGETYFQTHNNDEHLAMIEVLLDDRIPSNWVRSGKDSKNNTVSDHFESKERGSKSLALKWHRDASSDSKKRVRALKCLKDIVADKEHSLFLDFIKKVLQVDPEKRITANDALDHPYFDSLREKYRSQSEHRSLSGQHFPVQSNQGTEINLSEPMERSQISQNDLTSKSRGNSLSLSGPYSLSSFIDIEPKQPNSELFHKQVTLSNSRDNEEYLNFAMRGANLESQYP